MSFYTVLFLFSIRIVCAVSDTNASMQDYNLTALDDYDNETECSVEDKMKELRIQMVKLQILSVLNLTEAPPPVQVPSEALKEIIRFFIKEEEEWQEERERLLNTEERLVIHSKNSNTRCRFSNATYCQMHHFELNQPLSTSSVDLWIYKLAEYPKWISISLSPAISSDRNQYEVLYYEVHRAGWSKLQLPEMFIPPSWNESSYIIEIIGQNVVYTGELRPFLLISMLASTPSRQRREVACDTNESCCLIRFNVSFSDIGFNFVLYPSEFGANYCSGKCNRDPSTMRTHYERTMIKLMEIDNTLEDSLGQCWTNCCKPHTFDSVRLLLTDEVGKIHYLDMPELSVKSCSCS